MPSREVEFLCRENKRLKEMVLNLQKVRAMGADKPVAAPTVASPRHKSGLENLKVQDNLVETITRS